MQKSLVYLLLLAVGFFFSSCDGKDDPSPSKEKTAEELAVDALAGGSNITWTVANGGMVSKDEKPVTSDYSNFNLRLTTTATQRTYTTTPNAIFDQNGSWSFVGNNFDKIQFTGSQPAAGKEISFTRTEDRLWLRFNIPMPGPNKRVTALAGSYVFELVKK